MNQFTYVGPIPASKSLMNRALIVRSFFPQLELLGQSQADDVVKMKSALEAMKAGRSIECGHAGTVLRFMAFRVAREMGDFELNGSTRLFERPQQDLIPVLAQLGVEAHFAASSLRIRSNGWRPQGDAIHVPSSLSSQFASGLILSAWNLSAPLYILLTGSGSGQDLASISYLQMTIDLVRSLGMKITASDREIVIPARQQISVNSLIIEPDMSSAFALAAAAVVGGSIRLTGFPSHSLQPDFQFIKILENMGAAIELSDFTLTVKSANEWRAISADLKYTPDLFPVLAVLASLASGESFFQFVPQLEHKESNRWRRTIELIRLSGRTVEESVDGIRIMGVRAPQSKATTFFDPDQDHRLAMAASLYRLAGEPMEIRSPEVVNKSLPEYWRWIGWQP